MPLVEEGRVAPAFTLPDQDGTRVSLKELRGRPVVLYFYPKDDTSGCTAEACQFRDQLPDFQSADAVILGVSPDGVASHRRFVDKHGLPFTLLADEPPAAGGDPAVSARYGVWQEKSMYGRTYMGVVRTTYLIDAEGRVARRWDRVKVPGHAEAVLEAVRSL
jgi:peroxiredoxin Q/BCP